MANVALFLGVAAYMANAKGQTALFWHQPVPFWVDHYDEESFIIVGLQTILFMVQGFAVLFGEQPTALMKTVFCIQAALFAIHCVISFAAYLSGRRLV